MSITLSRPAPQAAPSASAGAGPMIRMLEDLRARGALRGTDIANITGVSAATVSRWLAARAAPHPRTQLLIADLRYVVERLAEFYAPEEVRVWLYARHRLLGDARPVDLIQAGRTEDVLGTIESLDGASYT